MRKVIRSECDRVPLRALITATSKIGPWRDRLECLLLANEDKPARERLTLFRLFEELRGFGYGGSYDAVRRYAISWRKERRRRNGTSLCASRCEYRRSRPCIPIGIRPPVPIMKPARVPI